MRRSHEYALALLEKARQDARAMVVLANDPTGADWIVGFHAQQAAEKAVKAVLTHHLLEYPLTHSLSVLLEHVRASGLPLPPDEASIAKLTPFAAILRYETAPTAPALDRAWARNVVEQTLCWAQGIAGTPRKKP